MELLNFLFDFFLDALLVSFLGWKSGSNGRTLAQQA
jgi:hypothetical protein